jgi:hypothetical protein
VAKLAKTVTAPKALGFALRTRFHNCSQALRRRASDIGAWLRKCSGDAKDEALSLATEVAQIAQHSLIDAQALLTNARRAIRLRHKATGHIRALIAKLARSISVVDHLIVQARSPIDGTMSEAPARCPDSRPIRRRCLDQPSSSATRPQIVDNAQGEVLDHRLMIGNPSNLPMGVR